MKESDVPRVGEVQGRPQPDVTSAPGQDGAPKPVRREADEEWLTLAGEDPAFFIKSSDAV